MENTHNHEWYQRHQHYDERCLKLSWQPNANGTRLAYSGLDHELYLHAACGWKGAIPCLMTAGNYQRLKYWPLTRLKILTVEEAKDINNWWSWEYWRFNIDAWNWIIDVQCRQMFTEALAERAAYPRGSYTPLVLKTFFPTAAARWNRRLHTTAQH